MVKISLTPASIKDPTIEASWLWDFPLGDAHGSSDADADILVLFT